MPIDINGSGTITGLSVGGLDDGVITPSELSTGAPTWDSQGNMGNIASINGGPLAGFRNAIINGRFAIAQRGTSFVATANNDDGYNLDRWYVLSDGNDVVDITRNTSVVPTGGKYALALDVETINKKFGIAQIIEHENCIGLIGETVTLSFKAKVSATTKLDNVKAAIVSWSGTADTVTSDIVSTWNVEGTNPTLIANATYENTPANLNLTTSYATYSVTAAVDTASAANIVVFIWSDVTDTTIGDFLYITDVQLELGSVATPFERRPIGTELALCQRYYETGSVYWGGYGQAGVGSYHSVQWKTQKRASPTLSYTPEPAPAPPPPEPDYTAFWASLLGSSVYGAIREQAMVSLPMNTLATEFIALLGDAKGGMAFPEVIQASMSAILTAGTFTPEHVAELQAALEASYLDAIYTLEVPES